jgi:alpha-amylase
MIAKTLRNSSTLALKSSSVIYSSKSRSVFSLNSCNQNNESLTSADANAIARNPTHRRRRTWRRRIVQNAQQQQQQQQQQEQQSQEQSREKRQYNIIVDDKLQVIITNESNNDNYEDDSRMKADMNKHVEEKSVCTRVHVKGPNRPGELASICSSLTSYGVDIIFAEVETVGCIVQFKEDLSRPSCAENVFWVRMNDEQLDSAQQEDLRAFLTDSLLPDDDIEKSSDEGDEDLSSSSSSNSSNSSYASSSSSSSSGGVGTYNNEQQNVQQEQEGGEKKPAEKKKKKTTEDLFKESTTEFTDEKMSGKYVGATEKVLAKTREFTSTMPNIYGQAAMSELKLLRKKPNARKLNATEARKESEAVVRSAQQLELAAAELAASAAALVQIERTSAQMECDVFDAEGNTVSKEVEDKCVQLDEARSDLRALFERRMAAMEAALATRDRVRDMMRKPSQANGNKAKNAYSAAVDTPEKVIPNIDAAVLASAAFEEFSEDENETVSFVENFDLIKRTRAQISIASSPAEAAKDDLEQQTKQQQQQQLKEAEEEKEKLSETQPVRFSPLARPLSSTPCGNGKEIILQGFNWESCNSKEKFSQSWYNRMIEESTDIARAGFTAVWMPPPTASVSKQGYMPTDLYSLDTFYGTEIELKACVKKLNEQNITAVADIVINHRCATKQDSEGRWNVYEGKLNWDQSAICSDNRAFGGRGNPKTGEDYGPAPNIDHRNEKIRNDIKEWLNWLRDDIGFRGWRFDFVKGYNGVFSGEYVESTRPFLAFGEYWDTCSYRDGILEFDQRAHRQRTCNWVDASGGNTAAFDFTTKGVLQEAVAREEYWRLIDFEGRPPGLCGIWPSRAVLFLENHDTGSTLQHWPFPTHKLEEGYAYILTHPGTPTVFYDHWTKKETVMVGGVQKANESLRNCIETLIKIRKRVGISSRSAIQILEAVSEGYAARIGVRKNVNSQSSSTEGGSTDLDLDQPSICMKIGSEDWSPNRSVVGGVGGRKWKCVASGKGWAVWEDKSFMTIDENGNVVVELVSQAA